MGETRVDLIIKGEKGQEVIKDVLVDTGASFSFLPKDRLERAGAFLLPEKTKVELGNGERVEAEAYAATVEVEGRVGPATILTFEGAKSVVGLSVLEALGLKVNPTTGKLEETRPSGVAYFY